MEQVKPFNPKFLLDQQVLQIKKYLVDGHEKFSIKTSKNIIEAKVVIIAAGAGMFVPNKPPLDDIEKFEEKSIHYYVKSTDIYRNKKVLIAGGGDSAVDWAVALSSVASKLYIVHRREKFRAMPANVNYMTKLASEGKIEIITGFQLDGLEGEADNLQSVIIKDLNNNTKKLDVDYLLPFYGLKQDLSIFESMDLKCNKLGIEVNYPYFQTNIEGIYAVGDVAKYEGKLKLILTGFAETASAIHHAYSRVFNGKALHFQHSTTKLSSHNE